MAAGGPLPLLAEGLGCGSPPLLAEGLGCGFPPLLAEVRWFVGRGLSLPAEGTRLAFPRHSWLGGPLVLVVGGPSPFLAEGPGCGSPPLLAGVCRVWWWPLLLGWVGGFPCCVFFCGAARAGVCVVCLWWWCGCGCVCRVCWCVCGVWRLVSLAGACCWCWCGCGSCVLWVVPRHSWRRFLSAVSRHSCLGFADGGGGCSSPLLAEAPGVVRRHSWLGSTGGGGVLLLATPGCGPGCGSPPLLAGVRRPRRWPFPWGRVGGFSGCVCLWRGACARGVCAGVCVVCLWWWRGCGCVFCVCWCLCVCACSVCGGCIPWLGLAAGVGVGVAGVCRGSSLATPGGGS